jgi:hypothetical protein
VRLARERERHLLAKVLAGGGAEEAHREFGRAVHTQDGHAVDVVRSGQERAIAADGDDQLGPFHVEGGVGPAHDERLRAEPVELSYHRVHGAQVLLVRAHPRADSRIASLDQQADTRVAFLFYDALIGGALRDYDHSWCRHSSSNRWGACA